MGRIRDVEAGAEQEPRSGKGAASGSGDSPVSPRRKRANTGRQDRAPRSSSQGKRDALAGVETKLTELLSGVAMMQATAGAMTGDPRHAAGADVTADFAPKLAAAWVKLGRSNPTVGTLLVKMSQGSEIGEVVMLTGMFAVTQAQIYGQLPPFPNPYLPDVPVPPSEEVRRHAASPTDNPVSPPPPVAPEGTQESASSRAERERKAAEEARKNNGPPGIE